MGRNREAVNNGYASAVRAVVARWDSLGLSRKAKVSSCLSSRSASLRMLCTPAAGEARLLAS